jgi:adenylate cyclase
MSGLFKDREKSLTIFISLAIVFAVVAIMYFQPPFFNRWIIKIESDTYDSEVRRFRKPLGPHPSIVIVDIDDKSIAEEGRWPWDRAKFAKLASELDRLGAKVVAFDILFSEPQENPVDTIRSKINDPTLSQNLEQVRGSLDTDTVFAAALKQGSYVLGFALASNGKEVGVLPPPLLTFNPQERINSSILEMNGYIGNLQPIQEAAKNGGFINTTIDADGILRFSPLLLQDKERIYSSLALEAARLYASLPFSGIETESAGNLRLIKAIRLGDLTIHTDPWGRILVPFRGPPYSFPYISATDLLQGRVAEEMIRGKLIFIGTAATASADLLATAISPVFPGVEVQATIASGILDRYLPYKPHWNRSTAIFLVLILGVLVAFAFPHMGHLASFLLMIAILVILKGINYWAWTRYELVLSFFLPMPTVGTIFLLDLISVYVVDKRRRKEMKQLFGASVHPDSLDQMIRKKKELTLSGEQKELTVLFADIVDFHRFEETLSAPELKEFLNTHFTSMTQAVFDEQGTVDKYVRDQLMAFWGAPLSEPQHAHHAVRAALAMQAKLPPTYKLAIGINTGLMNVGDMGSKYQRVYTVIGTPVDQAFHYKELTKTYHVPILVGEGTWKHTKDSFIYRKVDDSLYELIGPLDRHS